VNTLLKPFAIAAFLIATLVLRPAQANDLDTPIGTATANCMYNYALRLHQNGDARFARLVQETRRRGGGFYAAKSQRHTRDFISVTREADHACRGVK
jgi:hypothetical protein